MPRITVFFAWYDLWVGVFIDRPKRRVYVCLLPTLVVLLEWNNAAQGG